MALANAINNMRISVLLIVAIVGLVAFAMWLWSRHQGLKARDKEVTTKLKSEEKLTEVLSKLGSTVEVLSGGVVAMNSTQQATTDAIITSLAKNGSLVKALANKINGRLSPNDSARIVSNSFEKIVFREVCMVFERALRENDYENRKEYVARKVKTQLGEVVADVRETLASYPLGLDVRQYFPIDVSAPGERFLLVLTLWDRVEPLFMLHTPITQRVEEACLLVENTVRDHVMSCYQRILATSPQQKPTSASASFRTPLPGVDSDTDTNLPVQGGEFSRPGEPARNMARRLGV